MDNCVCCPLGKVVDKFNFKGGRKKKSKKLVGLSVECLGEGEGRGGQRALLFYCTLLKS